jgi:hypothetical protein
MSALVGSGVDKEVDPRVGCGVGVGEVAGMALEEKAGGEVVGPNCNTRARSFLINPVTTSSRSSLP